MRGVLIWSFLSRQVSRVLIDTMGVNGRHNGVKIKRLTGHRNLYEVKIRLLIPVFNLGSDLILNDRYTRQMSGHKALLMEN